MPAVTRLAFLPTGASRLFVLLALGLGLGAGLTGCPAPEEILEPLALEPGCNPLLAGADCLLPFPSDHHRVADASLPSGFRVHPEGAAKLRTNRGRSADPSDFRAVDGASRLPVILALLPGDVSREGLADIFADPTAPGGTLTGESRTVLLHAETGERIPHFVDLDVRASDPSRRAIVLRPLVLLAPRTRYVVALRGIAGTDGATLQTPEGFRRLRDRQAKGDGVLEPLLERYEREVFPVLERAAVKREELQLAWDFTTRSDEHAWRDMLRMRQLTLDWLAANALEVRVTEVRESLTGAWRSVRGELTVPLFMESAEPGARLFRGADGEVAQNGTTQIGFVAMVPETVRDRFEPGRAIAFGHGFFGLRYEIESPAYRKIANHLGAVLFSIDWMGMSAEDLATVSDAAVNRPSHLGLFVERLHQGMANWIVMLAAMEGPMRDLPALRRPTEANAPGVHVDDQGESNAGHLLFEPEARYFAGHSNGHILAGTLMALAPRVERWAVSVGGVGYSHMMFRSRNFMAFLDLLELSLPDRLDQQKLAAQLQPTFDFIDPASYAPLVFDAEATSAGVLPQTPPRRDVLMQLGLGDPQVPNFATFTHARLLGLELTGPSPVTPWGTTPRRPQDVERTSGLTVFDFGEDWQMYWREPQPDKPPNEVHDGVRLTRASMEQIDRFLRPDGIVTHPCDGVCGPE